MLLIYILPFVALVYLINSFLYNKIMDNILYLKIIIFMSVFAILYMQTTKFIDLSALTVNTNSINTILIFFILSVLGLVYISFLIELLLMRISILVTSFIHILLREEKSLKDKFSNARYEKIRIEIDHESLQKNKKDARYNKVKYYINKLFRKRI